MDAKNEDSGGSDSLDKSLQQKCKMEDGQQQLESNVLTVDSSGATNASATTPVTGEGGATVAATTSINLIHSKMSSEVLNAFKEHSEEANMKEQQNSLATDANPMNDEQRGGMYTKYQKTDNNYMLGNGINAAATEARESSLRFFKASSTITNTIFTRDDSSSSGSNSSNNTTNTNNSNNTKHHNYRMRSGNVNSSHYKKDGGGNMVEQEMVDADSEDDDDVDDTVTVLNNKNGIGIEIDDDNIMASNSVESCNNIETTVKQISQNLQETTLETSSTTTIAATAATISASVKPIAVKLTTSPANNENQQKTSTTSIPSALLPSSSNTIETPMNVDSPAFMMEADGGSSSSSSAYNGPSTSQNASLLLNQSESETSFMASDSAEENADQRSKKVRFHPDVKENDGGNRVIPKKKKKNRTPPTGEEGGPPQSPSAASTSQLSSPSPPSTPSSSTSPSSSSSSLSLSSPTTTTAVASSTNSGATVSVTATTVAAACGGCKMTPLERNTGGGNSNNNNNGSDMELDECNEAISEDEEDFDVDRTITEAEAYLKQNPITFVPPSLPHNNKLESNERTEDKKNRNKCIDNLRQLPSGLMSEEDLPSSSDDDENDEEGADGDFSTSPSRSATSVTDDRLTMMSSDIVTNGENGIENIYGKKTINGEHNYLLRYMNKSGLFWEKEDFIHKNCPNLLIMYEESQRKQQQRLMNYVSKRLSLRQRYTDF